MKTMTFFVVSGGVVMGHYECPLDACAHSKSLGSPARVVRSDGALIQSAVPFAYGSSSTWWGNARGAASELVEFDEMGAEAS